MTIRRSNNLNSGTAILSAKKIFAYGFSLRKRSIVKQFIHRDDIVFIDAASKVTEHGILLLWGRTQAPAPLPAEVKIVRLEDGFLRSVGLGADLVQPLSWVIDTRGIYFDATGVSDLEYMLENNVFDETLLTRAEAFRQHILQSGLTKYNVGDSHWLPPSNDKRIVLVPGQVETDASIKFGALNICRNIDLLKAVRAANPDAYVLYKPHPDVVAGLRGVGNGEAEAKQYCDELVIDVGMAELLDKVHEVHTMTSLTGFEALLRGRHVVCYGAPFYAGWGLTEDHLTISRRTRKLSLAALVAGAMLLYPTYVSRVNGGHISPEQALDELVAWHQATKAPQSWLNKGFRRLARKLLRRP
jgi:capsular polysaccharide export protein